ncbi:MAG: RNA polymerase sigma factor [Thermoanaerobaculia bacterium]
MADIDAPSRPSPGDVVPLEQAAVRRCQSGEIEGLEALYGIYAEPVFRTCFRILGDRAAAEDQTHEVFIRLFEQIGRFDGRSRFSTWLYRLAVNHTLNRLRKRKRRSAKLQRFVRTAELPARESPDRSILRREHVDHVKALLSRLPSDHRTILVLREIEELSYSEIAEVLGIARGTVMSRLHRARRELKRRWLENLAGNSATGADVKREGMES